MADILTDTIEGVTDGIKDLDNVALVSIDLQKAFDTLNHDILIKKLHFYGFRGTALSLLISLFFKHNSVRFC